MYILLDSEYSDVVPLPIVWKNGGGLRSVKTSDGNFDKNGSVLICHSANPLEVKTWEKKINTSASIS